MQHRRDRKTIPADLKRWINADNIADEIDDTTLAAMGAQVIKDVETDEASRYKWLDQLEKTLKIARQEIEAKNTPWPGAANTKYPLILKAAIQFNAYTLPQIAKDGKVVNVSVMLEDPSKEAEDRADRLEEHMSFQLSDQITNWKPDTDRLLMTLPTHGVVYRKSYFDSLDKKPAVDFCLPRDIIVNNNIESLDKAPRITHRLHLNRNEVISRMRSGLYLEYDIDELFGAKTDDEVSGLINEDGYQKAPSEPDYADEEVFYEAHTFWDLDDDGYCEPYIITVHCESQNVMRVKARYDEDSFAFEPGVDVFIKINPIQYFTDYHFIPAPDGSYHSLGFGHILYPMNEEINSLINQLMDAGTLANRGGGFISNGLRINKGPERFVLGEYKKINLAPGQSLAQSVFPLPVKEGSPTLFNLLSFLVSSAESIANVSTLIDSKSMPANTPATTMLAMIEQGAKVYSSMLIRLYEAFKKEFKKLYAINKKYLPDYEDYQLATKSGQIKLADYQDSSYAIEPTLDPNVSSDMHRLMRNKAIMQAAESPLWEAAGKDPYAHEIMRRFLESLHIQNIDQILPKPPTKEEMEKMPPSPQEQLAELELHKIGAEIGNIDADTEKKKMEKAEILMDKELDALKLNLQDEKQQADAAFMGSEVTATKINSVVKMAEVDSTLNAQAVEAAEKQVAQMTPPLEAPSANIENRLQLMENALQNVMGAQPQAPMQGQPQGAPPQQPQPPVETGNQAPEAPEEPPEGQQEAPPEQQE